MLLKLTGEDWRDLLQPLIAHATNRIQLRGRLHARIMLARLRGGEEIKRHVDGSPSAEVPHKIHIPITTRPSVRFQLGDGDDNLERVSAYEVNNRRPHAVQNGAAST